MMRSDAHELRREMAERWWLFLITGILWIVFSLMVLQFDMRSVVSIGILTGIAFIVAGFNEFLVMAVVRGWRWLHATLGVLFILTGFAALMWPSKTFVILANVVAWFLLFKGILDLVVAFATRGQDLWWVMLVSGILCIVIAFWAAGYPGRSVVLLILWVGISCLMRGVTELVLAFQLKGLKNQFVGPAVA
jgi:uncharacterized membrane protein HdeD (DUF308 family)